MILGIDNTGVVRLVSTGINASEMPTDFNGAQLTVRVLTRQEQTAFEALPQNRSGTTFDGTTFTALPADVTPRTRVLTVDALADLIRTKGLVTAQEVDAAKR